MAGNEIITDAPICQNCGHNETVTQKAWRLTHEGEDLNLFASANKEMIPLTAQSRAGTLAMPFVKMLMIHTDYCDKCGTKRATRAEIHTISTADVEKMMKEMQR